MKVLVMGATGMLGHALIRELSQAETFEVYGTARDPQVADALFPAPLLDRIATDIDAADLRAVRRLLARLRPDAVVNCIGVVEQDPDVADQLTTVAVNALFPHQLAHECAAFGTRLIHVSTDHVFSGEIGHYIETDTPDPKGPYGRSKLLGEVTRAPSLTLRTSVIGHPPASRRSFLDRFLSGPGVVRGCTRWVTSEITTTEFARLLRWIVLPRTDLTGLLHVASTPISRYDLLTMIGTAYGWRGQLVPYDGFVCDRSLSAARLFSLTGYRPPEWPRMIAEMRRAALSWRSAERHRQPTEVETAASPSPLEAPVGMVTTPAGRSMPR